MHTHIVQDRHTVHARISKHNREKQAESPHCRDMHLTHRNTHVTHPATQIHVYHTVHVVHAHVHKHSNVLVHTYCTTRAHTLPARVVLTVQLQSSPAAPAPAPEEQTPLGPHPQSERGCWCSPGGSRNLKEAKGRTDHNHKHHHLIHMCDGSMQ